MANKGVPIESVGSLLEQSLKRLDLMAQLHNYAVWPIWNDIVGPVIARNAQPEKIRNGTLIVKVSSPVWMQQLQFMKEMIATKLNQRLKEEIVKNIFFMTGRIDVGEELSAPRPTESAPDVESRIDEEFLQSIADPEIRAAFKKLVKSYSRRKPKF